MLRRGSRWTRRGTISEQNAFSNEAERSSANTSTSTSQWTVHFISLHAKSEAKRVSAWSFYDFPAKSPLRYSDSVLDSFVFQLCIIDCYCLSENINPKLNYGTYLAALEEENRSLIISHALLL